MFLFSCNDEEQFTTDPNAKVTFSEDTIMFDTVFSTIGSSTKKFQIYNNLDKGVRLSNIRLASGGKSGFRINVDGQYGSSFSNIEILKKDSIFVFVEVTVNPQDSDSPILVTDSLQVILENGKSQQMILQAYGQDIEIVKGLIIEKDTTMYSARPIVVYDSLVVREKATLTIKPGTTLCFHKDAFMDVHGQLKAEGTLEQPIIFRGDRTDKMFPYLPYDRLDGQWEGIRLSHSSTGNELDNVDIHGGNYGIICDSTGVESNKLTITNSTIHNVRGYCLYSISNKILVANSQLTNAGYNCIHIIGGECECYHTTIAQFYPWDGAFGEAVCFANIQNEQPYSLDALKFFNCIVTGYHEDELAGRKYEDGEKANAVQFNVEFNNCLVRTDTVGSSQYFNECVIDKVIQDPILGGETNFKSINTEIYAYDFRLDSLSLAIGLGNPNYSKLYPKDKNGVTRKTDHPDAGCYEKNN